jgi:hypothetical protein
MWPVLERLLDSSMFSPHGICLNGRQLAVEALNRRPKLKVLYTSGYTENAMVRDGRLEADVLLLAKPYRKVDLAKMIRTALVA